MLSPEEKLLIGVYSEEVFHGTFVRQMPPVCCGKRIDLYNVPSVRFVDVEVFGKKVTLIEPMCPVCGVWVAPRFGIVN